MRHAARDVPNEELRQERQRRGWSREYVAEQIGIADPKTIGRWERGSAFPSSYFLQQVCVLFGMTAQDLGLYQGEVHSTCTTTLPARCVQSQIYADRSRALYDPATPPPSIETGGLVGRDSLLQQIKTRLCSPRTAGLAALNGLPGVGKTAIAATLAHDDEVQQHFYDGILWAGLGPRPNILGLLSRWGTLLGLDPALMTTVVSEEAWSSIIRTAIGTRRMLLIIDDAWKSSEALAFKVGGPNCAYLLTSRIPSIALHFANAGAFSVRELDEEAGLDLLACFAPQIVTEEVEAARELVRSVGGLPLALVLVGKYLQMQAYSGQPRRLHRALERLCHAEDRLQLTMVCAPLERPLGLPTGIPVSLQAVIEISTWQLDDEEQRVLSSLSLFPAKPESFSEEEALAVSAASVETLDALIDAGLLEGDGYGRYTLHQTIADYARARLHDQAREMRMVSYFVEYAERHAEDHTALRQEASNILAALQMAFELGLHSSLVRGALAFAPFLRASGNDACAEWHLRRAEQAAQTLCDTASLARIVYYLEEPAPIGGIGPKVYTRRRQLPKHRLFAHSGEIRSPAIRLTPL